MELKKILKHTTPLIGTKVARFFIGLIRAKINAIFLGTTGLGVINQIKTATLSIGRFTLLSTNDGLVKQIAEGKGESDFLVRFKSSLKSYIIIISIILIIYYVRNAYAQPSCLWQSNYRYQHSFTKVFLE